MSHPASYVTLITQSWRSLFYATKPSRGLSVAVNGAFWRGFKRKHDGG